MKTVNGIANKQTMVLCFEPLQCHTCCTFIQCQEVEEEEDEEEEDEETSNMHEKSDRCSVIATFITYPLHWS